MQLHPMYIGLHRTRSVAANAQGTMAINMHDKHNIVNGEHGRPKGDGTSFDEEQTVINQQNTADMLLTCY